MSGSMSSILRRGFTTKVKKLHVAIVGSGPAGFYTAQQIIKARSDVCVDIYDKLPVPYGLVRFGIAPDHPEVKNVINTFTKTAMKENCSFIGNVNVGSDISVDDLRKAYNAVVLSYGADEDRTLGIPGEDLAGVHSARTFVGWYNGLPENSAFQPNLDTDTAVVLGQGNVAVDIARILLTPLDMLRKTDITEYALDALSKSRVQRVYLVGRRGPLQVAFTTAELREMIRLEGTRPLLYKNDFSGLEKLASKVPQKRRRLTQLLMKTALEEPGEKEAKIWKNSTREWSLKFLRSPSEFLAAADGNSLGAVRFKINKLQGEDTESQKAIATNETEDLPCGVAFRSIGYKSIPIPGVPFDENDAIIPNKFGRVVDKTGLYCSGWIKRGPVGVIASTMNDAFETGKVILDDFESGALGATECLGKSAVLSLLESNGVCSVSFEDWMKIDAEETAAGQRLNKPREKITDIKGLLQIAKS